ncbi:MAG TPA: glycosyl transferase family 2, partial [Rhodobacteraceae bacterium]|nr:glycosyl transferase family 2 [Paracoccaceae bacterium]
MVNYKTPELSLDSLDSLQPVSESDNIIVIDNASGDGSVEMLAHAILETSWRQTSV